MERRLALRAAAAAWVLGMLAMVGCGGAAYSPSARVGFDPNNAREVSDQDIRAAFQARPQLGASSRVAYYTFDPSKAPQIESTLRALPRVSGTYQIPSLLVTGQRRYDEASPWQPTRELSIHQLRLLAARARCDVLVVFDYGYRTERTPNGFAAFNVLLVPALFLPFLDTKVESYLEAYVIDTRNGYLYSQTSAERTNRASNLTVWTNPEPGMLDAQWTELLGSTRERLATLLTNSSADPAAVATGGEAP
jgi:hypothetical protein